MLQYVPYSAYPKGTPKESFYVPKSEVQLGHENLQVMRGTLELDLGDGQRLVDALSRVAIGTKSSKKASGDGWRADSASISSFDVSHLREEETSTDKDISDNGKIGVT